ncbi:TetR/AcrR family transcriptional regulator [Pedobacter sp. L105]|uniref:TetR/AcrR family transcriptional regulator n=1 Tax=Pedobacter sp. L105 TaxID=1641871 RepID=UPI00131B6D39|nr:TetR/AcrR family transcriptional regulator [Pedobacter sp. L105]
MNNTREKIVELSRDLIQQIGYHSFSYKQVSEQLNIQNASIHHYFPSKEDLAIAVIEKDKSDFAAMVKYLDTSDPADKLEAVLNNYVNYFNQGRKLCMISTFGSIYNNIPEKIQEAIRQYAASIKSWLTQVFKEGIDTGNFHFDSSVDDMVTSWFVSLPGSLQMGRLAGESYFREVIEQLRRSLKIK